MHTRTTIAIAVLAAGLLATACSSSSDSKPAAATSASEPASAETDTVPEAEVIITEAPISADFKIGEEASNYGTIVTVKKVREVNTITLAGATKKAGADAKYVILETVVRNDTKASMDLTCSLPIINALIDDQGRRFDTIEDLSDIPGNPECNAQLQPGFKDDMKFVYRVPKDANIVLWEFQEYDLEAELLPTLVGLT